MPTTKALPRPVQQAVSEIRQSQRMNQGIEMMLERKGELGDDMLRAMLAGIAMTPDARRHLEDALDSMWEKKKLGKTPEQGFEEVVIGGGIHAAIYCAVRVKMGYPKPLVIEKGRVGGVMATTKGSAFYLNSRNREGSLSVPGRPGALNVLPGAPLQPADISSEEYQRNDDLAFVTRMTLAMYANVVQGYEVDQVQVYSSSLNKYRLRVVDQSTGKSMYVYAGRVLMALGLGKEVQALREGAEPNKHLLSYLRFLRHMEENPFPLRNIKSIAVVGAGDSGKTVIETLLGQGPGKHMSVASLDRMNRIDWFGVSSSELSRAGFESCNRSRYKGIARALPRGQGEAALVKPIPSKVAGFANGFGCAYVDDVPYDLVVDCRGFRRNPLGEDYISFSNYVYADGDATRPLAFWDGAEAYRIGAHARLALTPREERMFSSISENVVALFRYAGRTATLAATLKGWDKTLKRWKKKPGASAGLPF